MAFRVAFLGFNDFERKSLAAYLRLAQNRHPSYEPVANLTAADYLVADADDLPSVHLVLATERLGETVFIGQHPPPGSVAALLRPIDALRVMRELDRLAGDAAGAPPDDPAVAPSTIVRAAHRLHGNDGLLTLPALPTLPEIPAAAPEAPPLTLRELPVPGAPVEQVVERSTMLLDIFSTPDPSLAAHEPPLPVRDDTASAEARVEPPAVAPPAARSAPAPARAAPARPSPAKTGKAQKAAKAPRATPSPAPSPAPNPASSTPRPTARLMPEVPRVLIVDDSAIAIAFLENRLARWPLLVDRASTSQQALALLAQHSHDIVFLDIELGSDSELDGLSLCQRIKRAPTLMHAMVCMVTAHHGEIDRVRGALAGCDAFLGKPLDDKALATLMQRQGLRQRADAGASAD